MKQTWLFLLFPAIYFESVSMSASRDFNFLKVENGSSEKDAIGIVPCTVVNIQDQLFDCLLTITDDDAIAAGFNGTLCIKCNLGLPGTAALNMSEFLGDVYFRKGKFFCSVKPGQ